MSSEPPHQAVPGLEVHVHRSVVEPMLVVGLPSSVAYIFWTIAAAIVIGLREIWVLPIALGFHAAGAAAVKSDPYFFTILANSLKSQRRLHP